MDALSQFRSIRDREIGRKQAEVDRLKAELKVAEVALAFAKGTAEVLVDPGSESGDVTVLLERAQVGPKLWKTILSKVLDGGDQ